MYEQYSPTSLDELVLSDSRRNKFEEYLNTKKIPNLLFVGEPGSGKSTFARILTRHRIKDVRDYKEVPGNAIKSDDVRPGGEIHGFMMHAPYKSSQRILVMEELQGGSELRKVYQLLRELIEKAVTCAVIVTTNSTSKVDGPLLQRFQRFDFVSLDSKYAVEKVEKILTAEEIKHDSQDAQEYVTRYSPSMRAVLQHIQQDTQIVNDEKVLVKSESFSINKRVVEIVMLVISTSNYTADNHQEILTLSKTGLVDYDYVFNRIVSVVSPVQALSIAEIINTEFNNIAKLLSIIKKILDNREMQLSMLQDLVSSSNDTKSLQQLVDYIQTKNKGN